MARKCKVYGSCIPLIGEKFLTAKDRFPRAIVSAPTKKRAVELLCQYVGHTTLYQFNNYWSQTYNPLEVGLGLDNPETVWYNDGYYYEQNFVQFTEKLR